MPTAPTSAAAVGASASPQEPLTARLASSQQVMESPSTGRVTTTMTTRRKRSSRVGLVGRTTWSPVSGWRVSRLDMACWLNGSLDVIRDMLTTYPVDARQRYGVTTLTPASSLTAPNVVCAAFSPNRKSLSLYVVNTSVG